MSCPIDHKVDTRKSPLADPKECPVNPANMMPDLHTRQSPGPDQIKKLSTHRTESSIPKAQAEDEGAKKWEYPSPQMFYNAMNRKGWDPKEEDMELVVSIHNTVNEMAWNKVTAWEKWRDPAADPKLVKFAGFASKYSPKARFRNWFMGAKLPFDRHDWVVERSNGETARYVIDYYHAKPKDEERTPIALHLDVRPALDSVDALKLRARAAWNDFWHGRTGGLN